MTTETKPRTLAAPAVYAALHVERRTARSFETTSPPDYFASWLIDQQYTPIQRQHDREYARFTRGEGLVVVFWSGSILCQGTNAAGAARLIDTICTGPSLADAPLFGGLEVQE